MAIQNRNLQGSQGSFTADIAFKQAVLLYLFESERGQASRADLMESVEIAVSRLSELTHVGARGSRVRLNKSGKSIAGMLATSFFRQVELADTQERTYRRRRESAARGGTATKRKAA